jgi:signal transduction histidine kinase
VIQTGHGIQLEVKDQNDGNWIYSYVTLEPILDSSGSVIGITGAVLDVTQQRQLEVRQAEYLMQMEVHRRLIQQRELERMNIARDLHDGTLQELTVISYELAEAVRACHEAAEKELLQSAQQKLKQQLQEIRIFCNELRPPALAPFGLETAIRSHVQEYSNRHPELKFHLNLQPDRQTLPEDTRMALFRIYQESLNNIIKHSHASQVWVTWNVDETEASLEIEDDGVGFDLPKDWIAQARTGHLGLIGMRERVESIGGEITFDANPGKGCHIHVRVSR